MYQKNDRHNCTSEAKSNAFELLLVYHVRQTSLYGNISSAAAFRLSTKN